MHVGRSESSSYLTGPASGAGWGPISRWLGDAEVLLSAYPIARLRAEIGMLKSMPIRSRLQPARDALRGAPKGPAKRVSEPSTPAMKIGGRFAVAGKGPSFEYRIELS